MTLPEPLHKFLTAPGVSDATYREWSDGGVRGWFKLQRSRTSDELRGLLPMLPVAAWIQFYDVDYPPVSDTGAFVRFTRHAEDEWSVAWSNYGWGSEHFPISLDDAVRYMLSCYETDWDGMMTKKKTTPELMVHQTVLEKLPPICSDQETSGVAYLRKRLANET